MIRNDVRKKFSKEREKGERDRDGRQFRAVHGGSKRERKRDTGQPREMKVNLYLILIPHSLLFCLLPFLVFLTLC